jgi:hypothetical protein
MKQLVFGSIEGYGSEKKGAISNNWYLVVVIIGYLITVT